MKLLKFAIAITTLAIASVSMAGETSKEPGSKTHPEPHPYRYGMDMDISELIKFEYLRPVPGSCGPIPAHMVYKDSNGAIKVVEYLYPDTSGCTD